MHFIYKVTDLSGKKKQFQLVKEVPLFGVKTGIVCDMLRNEMEQNNLDHQKWEIDVRECLTKKGHAQSALVIDFKPKQAQGLIHLQELVKVFGFSNAVWTPMLLCFRGLIIDRDKTYANKNDFIIDFDDVKGHDPVFSFTYRLGGIEQGVLTGRWTSSGPSSANSALLWPDAFRYLVSKCEEIIHARQTSQSSA